MVDYLETLNNFNKESYQEQIQQHKHPYKIKLVGYLEILNKFNKQDYLEKTQQLKLKLQILIKLKILYKEVYQLQIILLKNTYQIRRES